MTTPIDISNVLESIVNSHVQLKAYYTGTFDQFDSEKMAAQNYPFLYAEHSAVTMYEESTVIDFDCVLVTMMIEANQNTNYVLSDVMLMVQDIVVSFIQDYSSAHKMWTIDTPVNLQPITYEYNNSLTGYRFTLSINCPNPANLCDALH